MKRDLETLCHLDFIPTSFFSSHEFLLQNEMHSTEKSSHEVMHFLIIRFRSQGISEAALHLPHVKCINPSPPSSRDPEVKAGDSLASTNGGKISKNSPSLKVTVE